MELKEYIKSVLFENLSIDINFNIYAFIDEIYSCILKDRQSDIFEDSSFWSKSTIAVINYRINNHLWQRAKMAKLAQIRAENIYLETSIYISPQISIKSGLKIELGENSKIFGNGQIGENFSIFGRVVISSKQAESNGIVKIGNNVFVQEGASIWGSVEIGNNVKIGANCVVLENIESDCEVGIYSALQLTICKKKNILPSQKLRVYGVVPKYKNQLVIYGDGFYNPKVDLKVKDFKVESAISYWDKGTIILKIKPVKGSDENLKSKIIIKSNGYKVVVVNANGVFKALKQV